MVSVVSYGSVEEKPAVDPELDTADAAPATDFDAAYYLKDPKECWNARRLGNLLVPLIVAFLIMGGAALFLLRDFGTLYPGRGNGGVDTSRAIEPSNVSEKPTATKTSSSSASDASSTSSRHHKDFTLPNNAGANCNVHPDCSMLIGKCCPTDDGEMLDCCAF